MTEQSMIGKLEVLQKRHIDSDDIIGSSAIQSCIAIIRQHTAAQGDALKLITMVAKDASTNQWAVEILNKAIAAMSHVQALNMSAPCVQKALENEHVQSEIPVVAISESEAFALMDAAYIKAWGNPDYENRVNWRDAMEVAYDSLRPYLATPKPVSVSLEKCRLAAADAWNAYYVNPGESNFTERMAKAILDAAGVAYVD